MRYDRFDLKFTGNDYANPNFAASGDTDEGSAIIDGYIRTINNEWSPRVGVVVKPTPQLSFYGTYSRSFLPPSGDQFVLITPNLSALSPQGIENYEIGFKAEPQPNLFFTGALYIINRSNQPAAINSVNFVAVNTQTKGGEIGLVGQLTDKWRVSLGYGHQIGLITAVERRRPRPDQSVPDGRRSQDAQCPARHLLVVEQIRSVVALRRRSGRAGGGSRRGLQRQILSPRSTMRSSCRAMRAWTARSTSN